MSKKNPFEINIRGIFDDTDALKILTDNEGLASVEGQAILANTYFNLHLHRNSLDDGTGANKEFFLYSGSMSMIDPSSGRVLESEAKRRAKEEAGQVYSKKDIYASKTLRINCNDPSKLAALLRKRVDEMMLENGEQYMDLRIKSMTPQQVTPILSFAKYGEIFIDFRFPSASPDLKGKRLNSIRRIFELLPDIPYSKIKRDEVKKVLAEKKISDDALHLAQEFFNYLVSNNIVCGKSPFPARIREESLTRQSNTNFAPISIGDKVFAQIVLLLGKTIKIINCILMLLLSGFSLSDIDTLCWRDLEFVKGYDDYVIVHLIRPYLINAKHDYSRPLIPDAAKYIRKAYKEFCKQYGKEIVDAAPIFSSDIASQKVFERIEITEAANNILVRAGYTDPLRSPGPQGGKEAIPIKLLRSNYQHMLAEKAGLQNDPDTLNFLAGIQYKSSTYINYESHTDPDAQYRLYTILKPLSVEVKIPRGPEIEEVEGGIIFTSYPKTNHEFAQVTRTITFARGATPYILCDHGVSGSIDDEDENEFNSAQIQPDR